jgi:hypothetical protein
LSAGGLILSANFILLKIFRQLNIYAVIIKYHTPFLKNYFADSVMRYYFCSQPVSRQVLLILIKKGRGKRPDEALATLTSYSLV